MPTTQKIKVALYISTWFFVCCLLSYVFYEHDLKITWSLLIGFTPLTLTGLWVLYLFYPKFDPCCSVKFDSSKKLIALTFDDGPTPGFTDNIMDVLKTKNVKATFFMIGEKLEKNRELAIRVIKNGHDIGAHTYTHKKLHLSCTNTINQEIERSTSLIRSLYKEADKEKDYSPIFRSPHGFKNLKLKLYLKRQGLSLIPWTRGVWDTADPGAEWIFERSTSKPRANEILLLHDGNGLKKDLPSTQMAGLLQALPKVIDFYQNKGYKFIKVSSLIR